MSDATMQRVGYKEVSLDDIKKFIYIKLENPETSPTSICRAYEVLSGNIVSSKGESSRKHNQTVNVLISDKKQI